MSLEKELHQMVGKGLIDSSHKIVNEVNVELNVETTSKDTHILNIDVKQVSYIPTDIQSDTCLFNDHVPIALEQPATSNSIEYNISE